MFLGLLVGFVFSSSMMNWQGLKISNVIIYSADFHYKNQKEFNDSGSES